jgi:hypothetical protein
MQLIQATTALAIMFSSFARTTGFVAKSFARPTTTRSFVSPTLAVAAEKGQAEVILVGCGAPNRGMGWYHAVQMLDDR